MIMPHRLKSCRDHDAYRVQSSIFEQVADWCADAGLVNDKIRTADGSTSHHLGDALHDHRVRRPQGDALEVRHFEYLLDVLSENVPRIPNLGSRLRPLILQWLHAVPHNGDCGWVRTLTEIDANAEPVNAIGSNSHPGLTLVRE